MGDESDSGTGVSEEAPFSAEQLAMMARLIAARVAASSSPTLEGEPFSSGTPPSSTSGKTHFFRYHGGPDSNCPRKPTACLEHRVAPVVFFGPGAPGCCFRGVLRAWSTGSLPWRSFSPGGDISAGLDDAGKLRCRTRAWLIPLFPFYRRIPPDILTRLRRQRWSDEQLVVAVDYGAICG